MRLSFAARLSLLGSLVWGFTLSTQLIGHMHPQNSEPVWMRMLPEEAGSIFAVGFSFPYSSLDKTKAEATQNGIYELARYFSVQVRAESVWWSEEMEDELAAGRNTYAETLDTSLVNQIASVVTVVAQYREPYTSIYYVLLRLPVEIYDSTVISGHRPQKPAADYAASVNNPNPEPSWVTKIPKSSKAIFAVGFAERYSDPTVARRKSIENARSQLAKITQARVANLLDEWAGRNEEINLTFVRKISRVISNATLHGSQIVGFWSDPHSGESYSLVRMFKKSIAVSIRKQSSASVREASARDLNTTEIEAAANKALEDLDEALKEFSSKKE